MAPLAMKRIVINSCLRGTQFILLWRGLGRVGYGQFVAAGETQASMPTSSTAVTNAFPEPYGKHIDGTGLTIKSWLPRQGLSNSHERVHSSCL